jgi:hypothetical protein
MGISARIDSKITIIGCFIRQGDSIDRFVVGNFKAAMPFTFTVIIRSAGRGAWHCHPIYGGFGVESLAWK